MQRQQSSRAQDVAAACLAAVLVLAMMAVTPAEAQTRKARPTPLSATLELQIVDRPPVRRLPSASRDAKALNAMLAARAGRPKKPSKQAMAPVHRPALAPLAVRAPVNSAAASSTPHSAPVTAPASAPPVTTEAGAATSRAEPGSASPTSSAISPAGAAMTMDAFLDRLMMAESGGRATAKNPRSTALGPFQFIESTFLSLARRHFLTETAALSPPQILALRTDMGFSRKAAEVYTRENAAHLQANGVTPSYPNLRLAFLLGAGGAVRVLSVPPETPLYTLLGPAVLVANPFMATMTAHGLAQRAAREVNQPIGSQHGVQVPPGSAAPKRNAAPAVPVFCSLRLPSCKRWLALQTAKVRGTRRPARVADAPATKSAAERH